MGPYLYDQFSILQLCQIGKCVTLDLYTRQTALRAAAKHPGINEVTKRYVAEKLAEIDEEIKNKF